ncbi:MAG: oxidoreductase [Gemmataceae bacterium]|nr:oxidoreductase [Gemmataceae bacterium]
MSELHVPWLQLAIVIPLLGAWWVARQRRPEATRRWSVLASGLAFLCTVGACVDFHTLRTNQAADGWDLFRDLTGRELLVLDQLSAPLLPLAALLYLLTALATLGDKVRRFSFGWTLVSEAVVLAALSTREPWLVIGLLAVEPAPAWLELRARRKPARIFILHMALFVALLLAGQVLWETGAAGPSSWGVVLLLAAVLIRSGIAPCHCWITDLFEHATFGTALLFVTPLMGAYGAIRLVLPIAPAEVLRGIGIVSLATAAYAAGMALVQKEARRFFCYIFLSHSALVLAGLETVTPIGLTGGLCMWLSVGLALGGFGLTLRALEARHGRLSLTRFHGVYDHTPALAVCFLLTGMASVGFPGTFGFLGAEMLVDGAIVAYPFVGIAVAGAAALNGIAVVKAYFLLFTGTRHVSSVPLRIGWRERIAVLTLAGLLLGGGLIPQLSVASRHDAARRLIEERKARQAP